MNEEQNPQAPGQVDQSGAIRFDRPVGQQTAASPLKNSVKPPFTFWGYATVFYVVILILMASIPDLSGPLFFLELAGGVAVGINFLITMSKLGSNKNPLVRVFFILVGLGGGSFIFCASAMAGMMAYFSAHPIQGD